MDQYNAYTLTHNGIKNQKWGQRRWQNPDGSLTPAGRERYRKLAQKRRKLESKMDKMVPKEDKPAAEPEKKPMTDEELKAKTNRARLETDYFNAQAAWKASYSNLNPEPKSKGKEFLKKHGEALLDRLASKAVDVAGDYASKKAREWLGLSDPKKKSSTERVTDLKNNDTIRRYNEYELKINSLNKTRDKKNAKTVDAQIDQLRNKQRNLFYEKGGKKD